MASASNGAYDSGQYDFAKYDFIGAVASDATASFTTTSKTSQIIASVSDQISSFISTTATIPDITVSPTSQSVTFDTVSPNSLFSTSVIGQEVSFSPQFAFESSTYGVYGSGQYDLAKYDFKGAAAAEATVSFTTTSKTSQIIASVSGQTSSFSAATTTTPDITVSPASQSATFDAVSPSSLFTPSVVGQDVSFSPQSAQAPSKSTSLASTTEFTTSITDTSAIASSQSGATDPGISFTSEQSNATSIATPQIFEQNVSLSVTTTDAASLTLDPSAVSASFTTTNVSVSTTATSTVSSQTASFTPETTKLKIDAVRVLNDPYPLEFSTSDTNTSLVSPDGQDTKRPGILLKNQTEATKYDVRVKWTTPLDACLDIGISDKAETSIGNTDQTSDTFVTVTRINPETKEGVWLYADPSGCNYGLNSAETWVLDAVPVGVASSATMNATSEAATATKV